ncbi:MAG: hypothetical protein JJU36_10050 [Phycisphaeraceae bacterium]|nr:hypothetical protein [Phycisphaeraceae bacterium]
MSEVVGGGFGRTGEGVGEPGGWLDSIALGAALRAEQGRLGAANPGPDVAT